MLRSSETGKEQQLHQKVQRKPGQRYLILSKRLQNKMRVIKAPLALIVDGEPSPSDEIRRIFGGKTDIPRSVGGRTYEGVPTFTPESRFSAGTGFDTPGIEAEADHHGLDRQTMRDQLRTMMDTTGYSKADLDKKALKSNKSREQVYQEMREFYQGTGMAYDHAKKLSEQEGIPGSQMYSRYKKVKDDTGYSHQQLIDEAKKSSLVKDVPDNQRIYENIFKSMKDIKDLTGYSHSEIEQMAEYENNTFQDTYHYLRDIKHNTGHSRREIEDMAENEDKTYDEVYQRLKEPRD